MELRVEQKVVIKNNRSLTNPVVRPKLEIKTTEGSVIFDFGLT